jgi:hypothetical protein
LKLINLNTKPLGNFTKKYSEFVEDQLLKLVSLRRQKLWNIFETVREIFCRPVYSKNTACSGKGLTLEWRKKGGFFLVIKFLRTLRKLRRPIFDVSFFQSVKF